MKQISHCVNVSGLDSSEVREAGLGLLSRDRLPGRLGGEEIGPGDEDRQGKQGGEKQPAIVHGAFDSSL